MEDRVAIVTGAARGIGASVAQRLARDGFAVTLADLNEQRLNITKEEIFNEVGGDLLTCKVDVSDFGRSVKRNFYQ